MTRVRFGVYGHRGARGLFPENTLEGFQSAWTLGISRFELDIGLTADGVAVISHDPMLHPDIARDAAGAWRPNPGPLIHMLTATELARYDVGRLRPGSPTAASFPKQQLMDGARIPTLAAVLAALPDADLIIEIKTDPLHPDWTAAPSVLADAVVAEVDRAGAITRIVVESFDWRVQKHIRRVRPDIRLAYLTRPSAPPDPWWVGIDPSKHGGSIPACIAEAVGPAGHWVPVWAPAFATLTRGEVVEAHDRGLEVVPWTVNHADDMRRMVQWGVDGVISDYPDVLASVVAETASG